VAWIVAAADFNPGKQQFMKRETPMVPRLRIVAIWILVLVLLSLAACVTLPTPLPTPDAAMPVLATPVMETSSLDALAATQTQQQSDADNQAAATAEILRANAQATLDSANATLGAVQTQNQSNANSIAAQLAATAQMARAAARATLAAAGSTQSAAFTQDAIRQTQMADQATSAAGLVLNQNNRDELAADTQTAVANQIATQTQAAAATSQWYADQARQNDAQRQGPITFLWMVCLPVFIVVLAVLLLWGLWRWLKLEQDNQRNFGKTVENLPPPAVEVIDHRQPPSLPYVEKNVLDSPNQLTKPDDQMRGWLDEVKTELRSEDKKDEDGQPDN